MKTSFAPKPLSMHAPAVSGPAPTRRTLMRGMPRPSRPVATTAMSPVLLKSKQLSRSIHTVCAASSSMENCARSGGAVAPAGAQWLALLSASATVAVCDA